MLAKTLILNLVEKWYIPILILVVSFLILLAILLYDDNLIPFFGYKKLQYTIVIMLLINVLSILATFISAFKSFKRKEFFKGFILAITNILFFSFYILIFYMGISTLNESYHY